MPSAPLPTSPSPSGERAAFAFGRDSSPIYYRASGDPSGLAVVLSDGVGCDGYIWKYLTPALEPKHRVVHYHYRGHGLTPPPRSPERVELSDLADDLCAVLDTATDAALNGMNIVLPVDGMSSTELYGEQYVAWHMVNAPGVSQKTTLTSIDRIKF